MLSVLFTERCALGLGTVSKSGRSLMSIIPEIRVYPTGLTLYEFLFLQCSSVGCSSSCTWFTMSVTLILLIYSVHVVQTSSISMRWPGNTCGSRVRMFILVRFCLSVGTRPVLVLTSFHSVHWFSQKENRQSLRVDIMVGLAVFPVWMMWEIRTWGYNTGYVTVHFSSVSMQL